MKKILALAAVLCATAIMVQAQDAPAPAKPAKKALTAEQQKVQDAMLAKYDANKDGKLDKDERAKISQEDKDAMAKAGLTRGKKAAAPAAPAADAGK